MMKNKHGTPTTRPTKYIPILFYLFFACSDGLSILYEVKALVAVEGELLVAGNERHAFRYGVGNDDVVGRVSVVISSIEL